MAAAALARAPDAAAEASTARRLAPLPCVESGPLRPASPVYCRRDRHHVTPEFRAVLLRVSQHVADAHPGAVVRYMEASWPRGQRPMPPHLSHGDGRQIDIAVFYTDRSGRPLALPPPAPGERLARGYGAYEPPRREAERVCRGGPQTRPDPPPERTWRLDEARTRDLIRALLAEPGVRRIFLEPHLKSRLGLAGAERVRFAGCAAARHDDHIHVDFR